MNSLEKTAAMLTPSDGAGAPSSITLSKDSTSNDSFTSDEVIDLHTEDDNNHKLLRFNTSLPNEPNATGTNSSEAATTAALQNNSVKNKKLFPQKLWDLINDEKYNFCLRWSDDGQLVYLNRDEFEESYLKSFENQFHTQKAISFVRQMNMYGFRKVDDCYYENDNFKRNCEHLLKNMIRKHPNKNQVGYNDIAPYLYQQQSHSLNLSTVSSQHVAAAASLAAIQNYQQHPFVNTDQQCNVDRNHRYSYREQDRLKSPANASNNKNGQEGIDFNEDDSNSSFEEICCNSLNGKQESIGNALERLESNLSNELLDCTKFKPKQQKQNQMQQHHQQQQQTPAQEYQSLASQQLNSMRQLNSNLMNTFQTPQDNNLNVLGQLGDMNQLLNQYRNNQLLHHTIPTTGARGLTDDNVCNEDSSQSQNQLYHNQQELIKMWIDRQQQASNNVSTNNQTHEAMGLNTDGFSPLLALLSSMNANMRQPSSPLQVNHQNFDYDCNQMLNLQQLYQYASNLTSGNRPSNSLTDQQNLAQDLKCLPPTGESTTPIKSTERISLPTSLLAKDKSSNEISRPLKTANSSKYENGDTPNIYDLSRSSNEVAVVADVDLDLQPIRRETKLNRSFKRSVDSILDSNNNNSPNSTKKAKLDETQLSAGSDRLNAKAVNKNAKNLVTLIASTRDAKLDEDVLREASKYTERFVQTLFDTAQVIARHSNGSGGSSEASQFNENTTQNLNETGVDSRNNDNNEVDKSYINLSDLTSALKLLPSKILKILK